MCDNQPKKEQELIDLLMQAHTLLTSGDDYSVWSLACDSWLAQYDRMFGINQDKETPK